MKKSLAVLLSLLMVLAFAALPSLAKTQSGQIDDTPRATTDEVTIVLQTDDVWGDGSGYQMLLDSDATAYGSIFPAIGPLTNTVGEDAPAGLYDEFEYKIPVNADGSLNTTNIVCGDSIAITIPSGTYDWCLANPTPGDRIWIASDQGNIGGRADDFTFEAGKTYIFNVHLDSAGQYDQTDLTINGVSFEPTPSPTPTPKPNGWYFESGEELEDWGFLDQDGDGYEWQMRTYYSDEHVGPYEGACSMVSFSCIDRIEPLTPDNWLITPDIAGGGTLTFWMAGQDPAYAAEPIGIYISTDGGVTWGDELYHFIGTGEYVKQTVDLSGYAGMYVKVAFRHYDVTDMYAVSIDAVEVHDSAPVDPTPTPIPTQVPPTPDFGWYFESEEELSDWVRLDQDGDGENWKWYTYSGSEMYPYEGDGVMLSFSYKNFVGPLTPDNWLITPEITGGGMLTFWMTAQDIAYTAEPIGVYVSMDGGITWGDELYYFVATDEYVQQTVDLSDYADMDIKVAFRHYDVTDMYAVNIDAVEVINSNPPITTDTPEPITDVPIATDSPEPTTNVPIATDSPEPITNIPIVTDSPGPITDVPTPPATGAATLVSVGIVSIVGGSLITLFRRKKD